MPHAEILSNTGMRKFVIDSDTDRFLGAALLCVVLRSSSTWSHVRCAPALQAPGGTLGAIPDDRRPPTIRCPSHRPSRGMRACPCSSWGSGAGSTVRES